MRKIILVTIATCLTVGLGSLSGCASDGGAAASVESAYSDPAPGSKLSEVELGITDAAARKIMGEPDDTNAYMTGKAWIPFYFGPDTHRSDWMYEGQGRIVFSRNRWTGGLKVIRVLSNPNELR